MSRRILLVIVLMMTLILDRNVAHASLSDIPNLDYVEYKFQNSNSFRDINKFEDRIIVANYVDNQLQEFDLGQATLTNSIKLKEIPYRVVTNGSFLWVQTQYNVIDIVDIRNKVVIDSIQFPRNIVNMVSAGKFVWILFDPTTTIVRPGTDPFRPITNSSTLILKYDGATRKQVQAWCGLRYGGDNSACDPDRRLLFPDTVGYSTNMAAGSLTANSTNAWVCSGQNTKDSPIRKIDVVLEKVVSAIMFPESCSKMWASENLLAVRSNCNIYFFDAVTNIRVGTFILPIFGEFSCGFVEVLFEGRSIYIMITDLLAKDPAHYYEVDALDYRMREKILLPSLTAESFTLINGRIWGVVSPSSLQNPIQGKLFSFNTLTTRERITSELKAKVEAEARAKAEAEARAKAAAEKKLCDLRRQELSAISDKLQTLMKSNSGVFKELGSTASRLNNALKSTCISNVTLLDFQSEADALIMKYSIKKLTITCVKGKVSKKVTAVNPKCPKGYKKKQSLNS